MSGLGLSNIGTSPTVLAKAADQALTLDSTTVQTVTGFDFTAEASRVYVVEYVLFCVAANTTPDIKLALTGPASPTLVTYSAFGPRTATPDDLIKASAASAAFATELTVGLIGTMTPVILWGYISNGSTAGTVSLKAAQNTADAAATVTVKAGSHLKLHRVS